MNELFEYVLQFFVLLAAVYTLTRVISRAVMRTINENKESQDNNGEEKTQE